jgi:hypothetical protein
MLALLCMHHLPYNNCSRSRRIRRMYLYVCIDNIGTKMSPTMSVSRSSVKQHNIERRFEEASSPRPEPKSTPKPLPNSFLAARRRPRFPSYPSSRATVTRIRVCLQFCSLTSSVSRRDEGRLVVAGARGCEAPRPSIARRHRHEPHQVRSVAQHL